MPSLKLELLLRVQRYLPSSHLPLRSLPIMRDAYGPPLPLDRKLHRLEEPQILLELFVALNAWMLLCCDKLGLDNVQIHGLALE